MNLAIGQNNGVVIHDEKGRKHAGMVRPKNNPSEPKESIAAV